MKKTILFAALAALTCTVHAGDTSKELLVPASTLKKAHVVFTGLEGRDRSVFAYAGTIYSLNQDINSTGWFLRGSVGGGQYEYGRTAATGGKVTGSIVSFNASVGYKHYFNNELNVSAWGGPEVRDHDLDKSDTLNGTTGTEAGGRFGVELQDMTGPVYWSVMGQYSTIHDSIWTRARVGYRFEGEHQVTVGPQGNYLRDTGYEDRRVGGFVSFQINELIGMSLGAGYSDTNSKFGREGNSAYGEMGLVFCF